MEPPLNGDDKADHEQEAINREALFNEHRRTERLRNIWAVCVYALLVLAAVVVFITIFAVAWHYLAPDGWAWLEPEQLSAVRTFLFSGAVTGAAGWLGAYLRNRL